MGTIPFFQKRVSGGGGERLKSFNQFVNGDKHDF
jgi:hypothetical protein